MSSSNWRVRRGQDLPDLRKEPRYQLELAIKRLLDVLGCAVILVFGFPVFLLIAAMVKLSSAGPVFFLQTRVGKDEKQFLLIKFRSMRGSPAQNVSTWTRNEEARITPVGEFLRDYGLDELPQVINIIRGEMSIIGPRPPLPVQVMKYTPEERKAFRMRPGVLSLAAVEGRRSIPMEKRIELHVEYVENWSLGLDLKILWRALAVVLRREHASDVITTQDEDTRS
jgi:lipopolysaccharide/colanic/teichoic acid biosynthesis glycosyltransferase